MILRTVRTASLWLSSGLLLELYLDGGLARLKVQDGITYMSDCQLTCLGFLLCGLSTSSKLDHLYMVVLGQLSKKVKNRIYHSLFGLRSCITSLPSHPVSKSKSKCSQILVLSLNEKRCKVTQQRSNYYEYL